MPGALRTLLLTAVVGGLGALAPTTVFAGKTCEYTVKKGDTLSRIARRVGVSEKSLVRANPRLKKNPHLLKVNQTLQICRAKQFERGSPQRCGEGGRLIHHEVRKGETLGGVAARYDVERSAIRKLNKKLARRSNSMIVVGETLRICTTNRRYTHRAWLKEGIQLPTGEGYNVRRPDNAWGTPTTVEGIQAALDRYRKDEPDAPRVQIGDISRKTGGPLRAHLSHQDGRDVDIGYVWTERDEEGNRTMDLARTWTLLASFLQDDNVGTIFVDYRIQRRLYKHAESIGVEQSELDRAFEYPRNGDGESVLHHWRGHRDHFHVRFKARPTPDADEEPAPST